MATVNSLICWGGRSGKTVTMTVAAPAVVTLTNHGLRNGKVVVFSTTGALPTGIIAGTKYYARWVTVNTFHLYDTYAHAVAGGTTGRVNTSGSQSGTHTATGGYFSDMTADQKLRYGSAGSERIYSGMAAFLSGRAGASSLDVEVCEIAETWDDIVTSGMSLNLPAAEVRIESKIAGVRSGAYHWGLIGTNLPNTGLCNSGYALCLDAYYTDLLTFSAFRHTVDGVIIYSNRQNTTLAKFTNAAVGNAVKNCVAWGAIGADINQYRTGVFLTGASNAIVNNVALGFTGSSSAAFQFNDYSCKGCLIANNTAVKSNIGFAMQYAAADAGGGGWFYNNVAVGNTTNWSTYNSTYYHGAGNNYGEAGNTPWFKGSDTGIKTMTTSHFLDYTNNDFRPASGSAPQVDSGVTVVGMAALDIADGLRPNYNNGGAEAWDGGAHEFDHGYGLPPTTVTVTLTDLAAGSRVKIKRVSDGVSLHNGIVAGTTLSFSQAVGGDTAVQIFVRKGSAAPFFKPWKTTATISATTGLSLSVSQSPDIAAGSYRAGIATDWSINTSTLALTHVSGSTIYTVQELHSWLMDFYDDASTIDLDVPIDGTTPTIFSLINGAAITDADHQFLSGGSLSEAGGATLWSNVYSVGTLSGSPNIYVIQNSAKLSQYWPAGHVDLLVKVKAGGSLIAGGKVTLFAREYGKTYDHFEVDLSAGGRNVAPISTLDDGFNDTAEGTVAGYSDVAITFGDFSLDFGDGAGAQAYKCRIDCADRPLAEVYERTKYLTRRTSTASLLSDNGEEYIAAHASLTPVKAAPFGVYSGVWSLAPGVWLDNVPSVDHTNYIVTDTAGGTHQNVVVPGAISATVLAGTRVRVFNVTQGVEIDNVFVSGTSYSFSVTAGEAVQNDVITLTACKKAYREASAVGVYDATAGLQLLVSQSLHPVYAIWGIDGETCTEFSADVTGAIEIDANDADGSTQKTRLAAWHNYNLTTADGIRYYFGAIDFISPAAIRINVDVCDIKVSNINPAVPLRFTDLEVRLYRSDGTSIIADDSYSIHNDYSGVPDVVETGVSGLTGPESAQLFGLANAPSASAVADAVRTKLPEIELLDAAVSSLPTATEVADAVWSKTLP